MTEKRQIRIAINEPAPGWWDAVKRQAKVDGRSVEGLVRHAIYRYLIDAAQNPDELPPFPRKE